MNHPSSKTLTALWLAGLVMLNAWVMTNSVLLMDSARDFSAALSIAQGQHWPLMGPEFGGFIHSGPIWFYLLAVPLLSGSLWLSAFMIGLLAGLKFVLAFYLGKAWFNRRFAVLWSACFLLPGWHSINTFIPGHINVIDTLVLAFVASLWQFNQSKHIGWFYLSGLLLALAMHAHMTALIAGVFYLPILWHMRHHLRFWHVFVAGLLFLVPFVPYMVSQWLDGMGDWIRWQALSREVDQARRGLSGVDASFLFAFSGNLQALMVGGLQRMQGFVSSVWPTAGIVFWVLLSSLVALAVGYWGYSLLTKKGFRPLQTKVFITAGALLLIGLAMITVLRSFTPFYMLFVLTPLLTFIWAWCLSLGGQLPHTLTVLSVSVLLVLGTLPVAALQKAVYDGQVHLGPLGNVRQAVNTDWQTDNNTLDALTVSQVDDWATFLCRQNSQVHGPGAALLDLLSALPVKLVCPDNPVLLGGKPQAGYHQYLLMHRSFWAQSDRHPNQWITPAWGVSENIELINSHAALQAAEFDNYVHPPRSLRQQQSMQTVHKSFQSNHDSLVVVSHLLPFYTANNIKAVTANGHKVKKLMANIGNSLYYCAACEPGAVTWDFTLQSNDPAALDIIILKKHDP